MTLAPQKPIGPGATVTLRYRLALENGTVADESGEEPLRFTIGDGTLIEGLEAKLEGMHAGESARLMVAPQDAFGFHDTDNIHALPREDFPADMPLEPGTIIGFTAPSGDELPGMVVETDEQSVTVDFNHPLAGHELTFEVTVVAVE